MALQSNGDCFRLVLQEVPGLSANPLFPHLELGLAVHGTHPSPLELGPAVDGAVELLRGPGQEGLALGQPRGLGGGLELGLDEARLDEARLDEARLDGDHGQLDGAHGSGKPGGRVQFHP